MSLLEYIKEIESIMKFLLHRKCIFQSHFLFCLHVPQKSKNLLARLYHEWKNVNTHDERIYSLQVIGWISMFLRVMINKINPCL